jgi:hypothetical protein
MPVRVGICFSALVFLSLAGGAQVQDKETSSDTRGSIVGSNAYNNPALGITINLPGSWQFLGKATELDPESKAKQSTNHSDCQGPLCGGMAIDVAMESMSSGVLVHEISLGAFKLAEPYLNRERYPLKWFAQGMITGSMGNQWTSVEELTSVRLAGRPAFRMIVRNRSVPSTMGFAYVSESNGYVFLLMGAAMKNADDLQSAIEHMKPLSKDH